MDKLIGRVFVFVFGCGVGRSASCETGTWRRRGGGEVQKCDKYAVGIGQQSPIKGRSLLFLDIFVEPYDQFYSLGNHPAAAPRCIGHYFLGRMCVVDVYLVCRDAFG